MDSSSRPELFDFHGVSMTRFFTDNWENIQNFQARPDDILVATYPKAGQYMKTVKCKCLIAHNGGVYRGEKLGSFNFLLSVSL